MQSQSIIPLEDLSKVTSLFLNLDEKVEPRGDKTIFRKKKLKE
jgi:hypothetical protein